MIWQLAPFTVLLIVGCSGSDRRADRCAVCNGSNSTCRLVSGIFTRPQMPMGYNTITQLPQHACNLNISEMKPTRNYLALRRPDGSFVLNGNWAISWSGDFESKGTQFSYTRDDDQHLESISSPGPLAEPLDLMVIYQQFNPGIKYQYQLPLVRVDHGTKTSEIAPPLVRHTAFSMNVLPKDHKTTENGLDSRGKSSGPGSSAAPQVEWPGASAGPQHQWPGDEAVKSKPRRKRKFNWRITGFTQCSKSCGGGVQHAMVACVRENNQLTVSDRRCAAVEKPPLQTVRCNLKPCVAEWVGGEWSDCSVTCGEGVQTRDILCRQEITTTLIMTVADGACLTPPSPMLHRIRTCQRTPCPQSSGSEGHHEARWQAGLWSECSTTCGLGVRTRSVSCLGDSCASGERPTSESICDMGPCHSHSPHGRSVHSHLEPAADNQSQWLFTEWTSQCSDGCGTGVQTRKVHCLASDVQKCSLESRPDSSRACASDKLCGNQWFTSSWGQCTVSCGKGRQSRNVLCIAKTQGHFTILSDDLCTTADKPGVEQPCERGPCGPEWFTGDWSQCSRSCDTGVQRRDVRCLDERQEQSDLCHEITKPPSRRSCNTHKCSFPAGDPESPKATQSDGQTSGDQTQSTSSDNPTECTDQHYNCHLVVQARLCKYKYYRSSCCLSCFNKAGASHVNL